MEFDEIILLYVPLPGAVGVGNWIRLNWPNIKAQTVNTFSELFHQLDPIGHLQQSSFFFPNFPHWISLELISTGLPSLRIRTPNQSITQSADIASSIIQNGSLMNHIRIRFLIAESTAAIEVDSWIMQMR